MLLFCSAAPLAYHTYQTSVNLAIENLPPGISHQLCTGESG